MVSLSYHTPNQSPEEMPICPEEMPMGLDYWMDTAAGLYERPSSTRDCLERGWLSTVS